MSIDVAAPVFLLGMPRSGTTWLSQIFESAPQCVVRLSPPYAYDYRGRLDINSDGNEWCDVLRETINTKDPFLTQNWRRETGELTRFDKDLRQADYIAVKDTRFHDLYISAMAKLPRARLIYIVRHPAATLASWRSCKEFPSDANFEQEWRSGQCRKIEGDGEFWGFDDWLALTKSYFAAAKADPKRYLVVRYESLVTDARPTVERMFHFCGFDAPPETISFLEQSQSNHDPRPYSVLKGRAEPNAWRKVFPEHILREVETETAAAGLAELLR